MTQDRHEQNLVAMWDATTNMAISMLIGYSFACTSVPGDWHDDCMFLIEILRAKRDLDNDSD